MGKWRHRPNRRFFRQEKLPSPTPLPFHPQPPSPSEFWRDGIPQWEKEYCTLIGSIPWWKVVDAKNHMYGSSNVVNWDDSAGEEAFQNAKKRFWADINSLHCDISLPPSDIYIDEIDWNPFIDPDIVKEVDHAYFSPDDEGNDKSEHKKRKTEHSAVVPLDGHKCLPDTLTDPWECDNLQSSGNLQNAAQGWNQRNNHRGLVNGDDNPWERGISQSNVRMEITAWDDSRDKSWRLNQMGKDSLSKNWDDGGNPWARDCQGVNHAKGSNSWGDPLNKSWDSIQPKTNNLCDGENSWGCGPSQYNEASTKDRGWKDCGGEERRWKRCDSHINQSNNLDFRIKSNGWKDCGGEERRWKRCDSHINQSNNLDFRIKSNGWGTRNDSGQKRGQSHQQNSRLEGSDCQTGGYWNDSGQKRGQSHQYIAGYQNSRLQGSDCQAGGYWRRENNRKRVS